MLLMYKQDDRQAMINVELSDGQQRKLIIDDYCLISFLQRRKLITDLLMSPTITVADIN